MINLLTTLPFYENRAEQNQFRENCRDIYDFKYYSDKVNLMSWQILIPNTVAAITQIMLYSSKCTFIIDLTVNDFPIVTDGTNKWIIYDGSPLVFVRGDGVHEALNILPGFYEWRVTAGTKTYFSEQFYVPDPISICDSDWKIKIEAWNTEPWAGFYFNAATFKFRTYFDSFITNISALITDDNTKDGYNRDLISQRLVTPAFNINFDPMPNVLAVALGVLTAFKNIVITDRLGNQYVVKNVKYTQEPVDNGCLDQVTFQFTVFNADYIANICNK